MPNSVNDPKSLITRLPAGDYLGEAGTKPARSAWLKRLSRNIRGPGAALKPSKYGGGPVGRASPTFLLSGSSVRGIIPIEVRPGTLTADIAVVLPPGRTSVTLDYGSGATPATGVHTDSNFVTVAYSPGGVKTVKVTAVSVAGDYYGEVEFTV